MWGPRRARGPWLGPVIPRPLPEGSPRQERPSLIRAATAYPPRKPSMLKLVQLPPSRIFCPFFFSFNNF